MNFGVAGQESNLRHDKPRFFVLYRLGVNKDIHSTKLSYPPHDNFGFWILDERIFDLNQYPKLMELMLFTSIN